ncbi:glycosyl transferase family 2 [Bacilli bacterium]|nr:glycosyl transferase family 2 [Bacilli bacterium]GHU42213.1 glycosyl transferase family 2 [Bacilli bacterium]
MKISCVIATYNGERYIVEQLESLLHQTHQFEEVLLFDDCSTDRTVEIVKEFIHEKHLNNWSISINEVNKGFSRNFFDGLQKATGDFIFLCDQDDIWYSDKVQSMTDIMIASPQINILSGGYKPLVSKSMDLLSKIYYFFDDIFSKKNKKVVLQKFKRSSVYTTRPGWTYCIRKEFLDSYKNLYHNYSSHDGFFWRYGMINDSFYNFNYETGQFRRTSDSTSSFSNIKKNKVAREIELSENYKQICLDMLEYLSEIEVPNQKYKQKIYIKTIEYLDARMNFYKNKSVKKFLKLSRLSSYTRKVWYAKDCLNMLGKL